MQESADKEINSEQKMKETYKSCHVIGQKKHVDMGMPQKTQMQMPS